MQDIQRQGGPTGGLDPNAPVYTPVVEKHVFQARWYLNGFPKSGLHWLSTMMQPVAQVAPAIDEAIDKPWAGTFKHNSWTTEWVPIDKWAYRISLLQPGQFLYGHCGHDIDVNRFLWLLGVAHVFIYRDFRDVAVSQAHHVIDEDDIRFVHPEKELYREIHEREGIEGVIKACITGVDKYPGVMDRWEHYAGWLDEPWVLQVRYEDLAERPLHMAETIMEYGLRRVAAVFGVTISVNKSAFDFVAQLMVKSGNVKDASVTFRKGVVGGWKEHFTPEMKALFKQHDPNDWLVRLGYAEDGDW